MTKVRDQDSKVRGQRLKVKVWKRLDVKGQRKYLRGRRSGVELRYERTYRGSGQKLNFRDGR